MSEEDGSGDPANCADHSGNGTDHHDYFLSRPQEWLWGGVE
ncbi:MAG: hypothetical protein WCO00_00820 [Rhodospirillaceae bacterium]